MLESPIGRAQASMPPSLGSEGIESFAEIGLLEMMSK